MISISCDETGKGRQIGEILARALGAGLFTGASVAVMDGVGSGRRLTVVHAGRHDTDRRSRSVDDGSVYDLASMTKALATALVVHQFVHEGTISLSTPVTDVVPPTASMFPHGVPTVGHLLSHSSGLEAYAPLFRSSTSREGILGALHNLVAASPPGTRVVYSDLDYILLGEVLTSLAGDWPALHTRMVAPVTEGLLFGPVDPALLVSNRDPSSPPPPGHVHDENARVLGPPAGHAGLFGTVRGVADLAGALVDSWHGMGPYPKAMVRLMWTRANGRFTYGWDTPTGSMTTAGALATPRTVGHLGFTGTSVWLDPETGRGAILLTNRVRMGRHHPSILHLRRAIGDMAAQ